MACVLNPPPLILHAIEPKKSLDKQRQAFIKNDPERPVFDPANSHVSTSPHLFISSDLCLFFTIYLKFCVSFFTDQRPFAAEAKNMLSVILGLCLGFLLEGRSGIRLRARRARRASRCAVARRVAQGLRRGRSVDRPVGARSRGVLDQRMHMDCDLRYFSGNDQSGCVQSYQLISIAKEMLTLPSRSFITNCCTSTCRSGRR